MSVRRLAPKEQQPANFTFSAENLAWAKQQIAKYPEGRQQSAVIPLLWRAQEQAGGWTSQKAIEYVAEMLGMAYIRVLEVATFYTMFLLSPVGRKAHVQVCGTTPCMLRGAEELFKVCKRRIHHDPFHVSAKARRPEARLDDAGDAHGIQDEGNRLDAGRPDGVIVNEMQKGIGRQREEDTVRNAGRSKGEAQGRSRTKRARAPVCL